MGTTARPTRCARRCSASVTVHQGRCLSESINCSIPHTSDPGTLLLVPFHTPQNVLREILPLLNLVPPRYHFSGTCLNDVLTFKLDFLLGKLFLSGWESFFSVWKAEVEIITCPFPFLSVSIVLLEVQKRVRKEEVAAGHHHESSCSSPLPGGLQPDSTCPKKDTSLRNGDVKMSSPFSGHTIISKYTAYAQ